MTVAHTIDTDMVRDGYVSDYVQSSEWWVASVETRERWFDEWYAGLLPNEETLAGWIAEGYEPGAQPIGTHNRHDMRAAEYVLQRLRERMGIER